MNNLITLTLRSLVNRSLFIPHPSALIPLLLVFFFVSCEREQRNFRTAPPAARADTVTLSGIQPGQAYTPVQTKNTAEYKSYDLSQGKQLYEQYNCSGCHFHGGGGIGPPLMDEKWIYGADPQNIFQTIIEGRPNGMPSFRGKIPDSQVWQIVAYVRSMSGQVPKDVSMARSDEMNSQSEPEQLIERAQPKAAGQPPSTVQSK